MTGHTFRNPAQNQARDAMLERLATGTTPSGDLIVIGHRFGLYFGETTGVIGTLHKKGLIASAGQGYWKLPEPGEPTPARSNHDDLVAAGWEHHPAPNDAYPDGYYDRLTPYQETGRWDKELQVGQLIDILSVLPERATIVTNGAGDMGAVTPIYLQYNPTRNQVELGG